MFGIRTGIGIGGVGRQGALLNLTAEYKAILSKVTTKPSLSVQKAQNAFVLREIAGNRWGKYACLLPYAAGMPNPLDAIVWWNNPNRSGALSTTPPIYNIGSGFVGNGTSTYIDTTFNFSIDGGGKFTQNDNSHGYWLSNQRIVSDNNQRSGGQPGSYGNAIVPFVANSVYMSNNSDFKGAANTLGTQFLFISSRIASTGFKIYRDITDLGTQTQTSISLGNFKAYGLWSGQTGTGYSADTLGLQFYASSFTSADVIGLRASWLQLLADIYSFSDTCDGTLIDSNKWTITNPNSDVASFSQNNGLIMDTLTVNNLNTFANNIKSKFSALFGAWKFSLVDINHNNTSIREIGLIDINLNRIRLWRPTNHATLAFNVIDGYSNSKYSVDTTIDDFAQFKIVVTQSHDISCYVWANDAWVQIGVTYNYMLGSLALYMATRGNDGAKTIMRDIAFKSTDFTTLNP